MDYCDGIMYSIKSEDTLYSISMKYQVPLALLLRANPYVDVYNLRVGETICIPMKKKDSQNSYRYPRGCNCNWEEEMPGKMVMPRRGCEMEGTQETEDDVVEGAVTEDISDENMEAIQDRREVGQERERTRENNSIQWRRYVTKPGDTLQMLITDSDSLSGDQIEDFIERNGAGKIYLLPGIAYYTRK